MLVQANKAIVGTNAFAHESGTCAILAFIRTYFDCTYIHLHKVLYHGYQVSIRTVCLRIGELTRLWMHRALVRSASCMHTNIQKRYIHTYIHTYITTSVALYERYRLCRFE